MKKGIAMYGRSRKYQAQIARLAIARANKERKWLEEAIPADRPDLPDPRRMIAISDCDTCFLVTL
jgi:hypothetical protein